MTTKLICIECPRGCELTVETENGAVNKVAGNFCLKGKRYAAAECIKPVRVLTTTVRTTNGIMLPVKTTEAVDKSKMFEIMTKINLLTVDAPVSIGRIIAKNIDGTSVNLIATKTISAV